MKKTEIKTIRDLVNLKSVASIDYLIISSNLFGLFSLTSHYSYEKFNTGMILILTKCDSFDIDSISLAAYTKIIASRDFEYIRRTKKGKLYEYEFRFIKKLLSISDNNYLTPVSLYNTLPLRYKIADKINNHLIKLGIHEIAKKFLLKIFK